METQDDHYSYLGLEPFAPTQEVEATVERLRKQAGALENTSPARAQEVRTRLRRIQHDLLTTERRREAYDDALVDAVQRRRLQDAEESPDLVVAQTSEPNTPRAITGSASRSGPSSPPGPASSVASRRNMLLLGGVALLVVLAAAGGGFAIARSALESHSSGTPAATSPAIAATRTPASSATRVRRTPKTALQQTSTPPQVTPTPPPQPTSAPRLDSTTATSTVNEFYDDINNQDYSSAYALLGTQWRQQQSYSNFANGFSGTARDDLTIVSTDPAGPGRYRVSVRLSAAQSDGSVQHYSGSYVIGIEQGEVHLLQGKLTLDYA